MGFAPDYLINRFFTYRNRFIVLNPQLSHFVKIIQNVIQNVKAMDAIIQTVKKTPDAHKAKEMKVRYLNLYFMSHN